MRREVWLRKGDSFEEEEQADCEFWQQMTGRERVEILEEMRRDAWKITGEPLGRLQRSVRIIERPWG